MPARRDYTPEELSERLERRREQTRQAVARHRARKHDGVSLTNRGETEVSVTGAALSPLPPPPSPPSPEVSPHTPLPLPLSPLPPYPPSPLSQNGATKSGYRLLPNPETRTPIEDVLSELFGMPGTPREEQTRKAAAVQFKRGAQLTGISLQCQAERIRLAYQRYCESYDSWCTPHALAAHLGELLADQFTRRPAKLRREVVQRVTQYATKRVERPFADLIDQAEREAGG